MLLRPYQEKVVGKAIKALADHGDTLIVAATGCHAKGTGIVMYDGSVKKVEDIKVGDRLMGPDSTPRTVLELHHGHDDMHEVQPIRGSAFIVNGGHILSLQQTKRREGDKKANSIVNVSVREWLSWNKHQKHLHKLYRAKTINFCHNKMGLPIDPYFLGVLIGDGSLRYGVTVNTMDKEIVDMLRDQAAIWGLSLKTREDVNSKANTYVFSGWYRVRNPLSEELRKLGLFGKLSVDKFVPQVYKTASIDHRLQLLAGLLDTDGYTDKRKCCEFSTGSERLAEDVAFIARSLGFYCTPKEKRVNGKIYWRFDICGDLSRIPFRVERRKASVRLQKKDVLRTGFTIKHIGKGEYFGFAVDGDNLYLMEDFTVTHNSGKTWMLSTIAGKIGGKQLVLQHRQELVQQNLNKFKIINPEVSCGLWTATQKSFEADATFAMVQSLEKHVEQIPKIDLLIADEAHHCAAPTWRKIIEAVKAKNPDCKILGVTATPKRADSKGLRSVFSNICSQVTAKELINKGFLVPYRTFVVSIGDTIEELKKLSSQPDFGDQDAVAEILNTTPINKEIVRNWELYAKNRPTVIFASTVQHAQDVATAFLEAGIHAECVHGEMSQITRKVILQEMTEGKVKIVTNAMVLTEGWDYPPVSCVILLRKCSSKSTMIQMVGRGLRTVNPSEYPGVIKKDCIVLDFGASLLTHESLEADSELDADATGKGEGEARTKKCPECGIELPIQLRFCPVCGYAFTTEEEDGSIAHIELTEIDILNKSPWRYVDLWGNGLGMLAGGFNAWSAIFSPDNENWYAVGKVQDQKRVQLLHVGGRVQALASADDFLRLHETSSSAKKTKRWLDEQATPRQMEILEQMFGYPSVPFTKYAASCHLNYNFAARQIARILGVA